MTRAGEFAGFVLPFAAGIFLATGIGFINSTYGTAACGVSMALTAGVLMFMIHPMRHRCGDAAGRIMLALLGFCAGAFTGLTAGIMDISSSESSLGIWAAGLGRRMGDAIDRIPFRDGETNAVIKALVTGERNDIPRAVTEAFRDSGASHILALSGFHLGIIYGMVRLLLMPVGNSPRASRIRSAFTIILCGFYTLVTGAGPSIVRSFLFILLGETSRIFNRRQSTGSILISSMLLQLIIDPTSIRSVSFQLSYAAMAGIAWIYPWLRDLWPGNPSEDRRFTRCVRWVWNSAALSISCQLTTGPLAYLYFGTFPRHFLLTNLIALPLTAFIIPSGLITLILNTIDICPDILIQATELAVTALVSSLEIISSM